MDKNSRPKIPVLVVKENENYIVFCLDFAVANQGKTLNSAIYKVKEGLEIFLDEIDNKNDFIPLKNN